MQRVFWQMRNGTRSMAFAPRPLHRVRWQVQRVFCDLQGAKWPVAPVLCGAHHGLCKLQRVICLTRMGAAGTDAHMLLLRYTILARGIISCQTTILW
ncbi:MAG: hypothetical protein EA407_13800 [Rhodobacteraceae bacterium]|nr:MAG: hypothetical protein EA407_13800 [Paracoccaceae bacterium]